MVALEPETGKVIWAYALKDANPGDRGLEYYRGDKQSPPQFVLAARTPSLIHSMQKLASEFPVLGTKGWWI